MEDSDTRIEETRSRSWVGLMLGVWLSSVFAASLLGKMDSDPSGRLGFVLLAMALAWPPVYFMFSRCRFFPRRLSGGSLVALIMFSGFCALSSFGSARALESIGYSLLTLMTFGVVLQFNSNLDAVQYERGLKAYALVMLLLVLSFSAYDYVPGIRLGRGKDLLNPNTLALVAMSVLLAGMAIRMIPLRLIVIVAMGAVIVLTGSRAAAVASLAGLGVILLLRLRVARTSSILIVLAVLAMAGLLLASYYADATVRELDQFFALRDQHRGLESGASGRSLAWQGTWKLFLSHPLFGVGFRTHEYLLKVGTSSHNGYLALLAEVGLVGFAAALFLALSGMVRVWQRMKEPTQIHSHSILFGLGCGYFALALFERYLINVGNPTSLLFLVTILMPAMPLEALMQTRETGEDWQREGRLDGQSFPRLQTL